MGLDIYAGTLTRYYAHNWKTVTQQWLLFFPHHSSGTECGSGTGPRSTGNKKSHGKLAEPDPGGYFI